MAIYCAIYRNILRYLLQYTVLLGRNIIAVYGTILGWDFALRNYVGLINLKYCLIERNIATIYRNILRIYHKFNDN